MLKSLIEQVFLFWPRPTTVARFANLLMRVNAESNQWPSRTIGGMGFHAGFICPCDHVRRLVDVRDVSEDHCPHAPARHGA